LNKKHIALFCAAIAAAFAVFISCQSLPPWLADFDEPAAAIGDASGTASGTGAGFGGEITVTLSIDGGWITDVQVSGSGETPSIGGIVMTRAPDLIKKRNAAQFEAVSGATITSNGISAAAQQAIDKIVAGLEE
jgi:fumarate reductase flavoprotein subunit